MSTDAFVRETRRGLQRLSDGLVALESDGDRETVDDLFRTAHSLKSTFGMEDHDRASDLAHALEDVLGAVRATRLEPDGRPIDEALDATDTLGTMLNEIERNGTTRTDPQVHIDALRRIVDEEADTGPNSVPDRSDGDGGDAEPGDEAVQEALAAASEFDDLDALVEDMEEPGHGTLEGGGSFEDLFGEDTGPTDDGPATTDTDPDGTAPFAEIKSTVDEDESLAELQAEIEAESFGEFDEDDDMSIQELVSVEPAADGEPEAPVSGSASGTDSAGATTDADPATDDADETAALSEVLDALGGNGPGGAATGESGAVDDAVAGEGEGWDGLDRSSRPEGLTRPSGLGDADNDTEVSAFGEDAGMAAFESRFESLFGGDGAASESDGDAGGVARAAATIEESSLPTERYRPADGVADRPADDVADRVQSLTVDIEYADDLLSLAKELSVDTQRLTEQAEAPAATETAESVAASVRDLQRTVMEIRLMPVETVTGRLDRVVRDAARGTEKRVDLRVEGAGTRVDRSIIDRLRDPLVHLVRNAVDHGIEPPAEREAAAKPATGVVEITVSRRGDEVLVEVADDGRGIDPDAVRGSAVEAGVLDRAEAASLSTPEVYDLVFHPGLSTADSVTNTSGRGVGLDAVNEAVGAVDGDLTVESRRGSGTTVRLRLPVTMATAEMVIVAAGDGEFAIPVADVRRVGPAGGGRLTDGLRTAGADRRVDLADVMGVGAVGEDPSIVSVDTREGPLNVACDRVIDRRETIVTPYDDLLSDVPGVSGATTGTAGQLIHVVDVEDV